MFAVAFGIGIGLCGLSYALPSSDSEFHTNWLSLPSVLVMIVSLLGLIVTLIGWVIAAATGELSAGNSGPQTLFGNSGNDKSSKSESEER